MMDSLWYFDRLGIAPTEEERAIRRSYAIALKRIDQETQPKEFEQLRRAYELALQWRESNDAFDEEDDGTDCKRADEVAIDATERGTSPFGGSAHDSESPAVDTAARPLAPVAVSRVERLESAHSVASAAEQPTSTAAVVVTRGAQPQVTSRNQISAHETDSSPRADDGTRVHALFDAFVPQLTASPSQAAALLAATMRDDALIPIGARAQFEERLAAWLHDHPHPNHVLFDAAVAQFGWREHLPEVGWNTQFWLKQTVDEWCHWNSEDLNLRVRVLRAAEAAEKGNIRRISRNDLLAHGRALALAQARYPQWLRLRLSDAQLEAWNARVARKATRLWPRFQATLAPLPQWQKNVISMGVGLLFSAVFLAVLIVGGRTLAGYGITSGILADSVISFKSSPEFCSIRARRGGPWADLYNNQETYLSFKQEVQDCLENHWWPGGQQAADDYLHRLRAAWADADDKNNARVADDAVADPKDSRHAPIEFCDADPEIEQNRAHCVALAGTYTKRNLRRSDADAGSRASTLTVGPGGRLVIGADGVQVEGDVRIDDKPVAGRRLSSKPEANELPVSPVPPVKSSLQEPHVASPTSAPQSDIDASRSLKPPGKAPFSRTEAQREVPATTASTPSVSPTDCNNAYASLRHGSWKFFNKPETRPEREQRVFACVSASLWPGGPREPLAHLLREIRRVSLNSKTRDTSPPLSRGMVTGAETIRTIHKDFNGPITNKMCDQIRAFAYQSDWRATGDPSATQQLERQIVLCVEKDSGSGGLWFGGRADPISNLIREVREQRTLLGGSS
jgi:hypothetical protein